MWELKQEAGVTRDKLVLLNNKELKQVSIGIDSNDDIGIYLFHQTPDTDVVIEKKRNPLLYEAFAGFFDGLYGTYERLVELGIDTGPLRVLNNQSIEWQSVAAKHDGRTNSALNISKSSQEIKWHFNNKSMEYTWCINVNANTNKQEDGLYYRDFMMLYGNLMQIKQQQKQLKRRRGKR